MALGRHLRLQARRGQRAAVVELRPGLWLVAAVAEETLRTVVTLNALKTTLAALTLNALETTITLWALFTLDAL